MIYKFFVLVSMILFSTCSLWAQTNSFTSLTLNDYPRITSEISNADKERKLQLQLWIGGLGVIDENQYYGYGGQADVVLKLGKRFALGGLANLQWIDGENLTPIMPYARISFNSTTAIQGGYGWFMEDFDYDFSLASNGFYGAIILGMKKVSLEIGGYVPDDFDARLTVALKFRLFKI